MKTTTSTAFGVNSRFRPEAWVATQKNRQKIYKGSKVYLHDGQEFEIELHNPTKSVYLAKVLINGKHISSRGIILQPGQRVFLERFIDENRKLVYETYEVEETEEAREAIADNGRVSVLFFEEYNHISFGGTTTTTIWATGTYTPIWTTYGDSSTFTMNTSMSGEPSLNFMSTSDSTVNYETRTASAGSLETGRVQQGDESEQTFENGYGTFNSWASHTSSYQILPISQLPIETSEIRNYCSGCGTRIRKSTWKFCPNCGESLE